MPPKSIAISFAAIILALLAGCVLDSRPNIDEKKSGNVLGSRLDEPGSERYQQTQGIRYEQPLPSPDNPQPEYPRTLLQQHLDPIEVRIRIIVNEKGHVVQVDRLGSNTDRSEFWENIELAVARWKFTPLVRIIEGDGVSTIHSGGAIATYHGKATALPFHQDYIFEFIQVNGNTSVRIKK